MVEESTGGMGFLQKLPAQKTRNPPEELDSARKNQLIQTGNIKICKKSSKQ
jgi:hypothetical protein